MIGTILVALAFAAAPAVASHPAQAFTHAWLGDHAGARAELAKSLPGHPGAAVVAVCVEVEAGDLRAAAAKLEALERIRPAPPEAAVLRALVARRRSAPAEQMTVALAEAWRAAGSPDLSGGDLVALMQKAGLRALFPLPDAEAVAQLSPGEAYLLGPVLAPRPDPGEAIDLAWFDEHNTRASALAANPAANGTAVNLALLYRPQTEHRASVLAELRLRLPDNALVALASAVEGGQPSESLTATEIEAIEAASRRSSWAGTTSLLFAEISTLTRRVAPAHAVLHARIAYESAVRLPIVPVYLRERALATTDPALRARAAVAIGAIGAGLGRSGALVDRTAGMMLAWTALELQGDVAGAERLAEEALVLRRHLDLRSRLALDAWPLPSLWREWRPQDEVATLLRLAR